VLRRYIPKPDGRRRPLAIPTVKDRVAQAAAKLVLEQRGALVDPQFTTLVVWTLPGRDFVCVEPWTAPGGALATGLALPLAPGAVERLAVVMGLD